MSKLTYDSGQIIDCHHVDDDELLATINNKLNKLFIQDYLYM
jgi:hypothetical protein